MATEGVFTATAGSFETFAGDGSYFRRSQRVGVSISAAGRRTNGAFDHSSSEQMLVRGALDGALRTVFWRWDIAADDRDTDDPGALPRSVIVESPYSSDPIYRFDGVDRRSFSTAVVLRTGTSAWVPQGRVYTTVRDEDLIRTIPLAPGLSDTRARALSSSAFGGSFDAERRLPVGRPVLTRFGIDLAREHLDTSYIGVSSAGAIGALNNSAEGHRVRSGLFASVAWDAASRLRLTSGVRWDNVSDEGFQADSDQSGESQRAWSPRAGVVFRMSDRGSVSLYGQVSRAFKAPTLDQLFDTRPYPDFRGGTFTISNPGLVPQRATNMEVGVSGATHIRWSALVYHMMVDDEIDFDPRTFSYANIGESRHTGLELELDGRTWRHVQPSITYAFSRVVSVGDDRQLNNVPRHALSLGATVDLPWRIGVFGRYAKNWGAFLDRDNLLAVDGASVVDLRVRRPLGRHMVFADILNLTDDTYEEYGFTLVGFTGATVPYAYPGAPRAARVGMTVAF
jgi:outer membrane receptor protein involved in Fe transport